MFHAFHYHSPQWEFPILNGFFESWPYGNITISNVLRQTRKQQFREGKIKRIHMILRFNRVLPLSAVSCMMACSTRFRILKGRDRLFILCWHHCIIFLEQRWVSQGNGDEQQGEGRWAKREQTAYSSNRQVVRMALQTAYGSQFELGRRSSR